MRKNKILKFPDGFLWGAATSAYQVEGGITNNDWAVSKRFAPAGRACDHYNRFEEDFAIAKSLNQNAHRLSLEWSRIEPSQGVWDEEEIHHYFHVLQSLKRNGFTTFVTLHHFTNPIWFASQGGWTNPKAIEYFANFVEKVIHELGSMIVFWVTVNEPNIYANLGFFRGLWPPFQRGLLKTYKVYQHMLMAHNRAYEMIHAYYPEAQVGFAQNISFNQPYKASSFFDNSLVKFSDWVNIDYAYMHTRSDFIGLNHYSRNLRKFGNFERHRPVKQKEPELSDKGWEIYPEGIYKVLMGLKRFGKPIYITENGVADAGDKKRAKFIVEYLLAIHRAIEKAIPVRGYFYWSLMDNYEWPVKKEEKTGYEMKFGLVEIDFVHNLKRTVRKSARVYAKICKSNQLTL